MVRRGTTTTCTCGLKWGDERDKRDTLHLDLASIDEVTRYSMFPWPYYPNATDDTLGVLGFHRLHNKHITDLHMLISRQLILLQVENESI